MKLTMLGTGNAFVTECYNTCFVIETDGKYMMVDAGGGNTVLAQLKKANLNWQDMREIFITHKHIDHILGAVWMVRIICQNMAQGKYEGEATMYGHAEVIEMIKTMAEGLLQAKHAKLIGDRFHLVTVEDGETREINGRKVTFFDVGSTKDKQFGFTMEMDAGKKLTCCGDEPYSECEYEYVKDADWLLHEAFCLYSEADIYKPYEKHHSTAKDACELAESLGVKNIVMYHTEDKNIKNRKELYTAEGRSYFSGNIFVPDDLETIELD